MPQTPDHRTSNSKYAEIVKLSPVNTELNISEIADFIIDLEYDIPTHIDPRITLRNINFILSCYIWYYVREEEEDWEIITPLATQQKEIADQQLVKSYHEYKSRRFFEQQTGIYHTVQRIPKSLFIGSNVGIVSSIGAVLAVGFCVESTANVLSKNMKTAVNIFTKSNSAKDTLIKLPEIPLNICA
eukprot:223734_1